MVFFVGLCGLATGVADSEDAYLHCLAYLARHQRPDGSWGRRPEGCGCPRAAPAPWSVKRSLRESDIPVIASLGEDDISARAEAHRWLLRMGVAALPALRTGVRDPDSEIAGRCRELWNQLAVSPGNDIRTTALSLLPFFGAGYSHLSKETYEGVCFGQVVWRGLWWLVGRQGEQGKFDGEDLVANSLAALALSEAYGLTGSFLWKEAATKAAHFVRDNPSTDPAVMAWRALALGSAETCELGHGFHAELANVARFFGAREGRRARFAGSLAARGAGVPPDRAEEVFRPPDPVPEDPENLFFGTLAIASTRGKAWRREAWAQKMRKHLVSTQNPGRSGCRKGAWEGPGVRGRVEATAFRSLTLEIFYRYGSILGPLRR